MPRATDGRRLLPFDLPDVQSIVAPQAAAVSRGRAVLPTLLVAGCVLAGAGLRVAAYAQNRSLWGDEAMLALNVVHRTPAELLRPLDLNQGAPVGYLLASKLAVKWFGPGELALRGGSLAAGLVGLALFVSLAYRALPAAAARLAVALYALSPYLVGYSAEFKQYELDAAVAVGLTLVGVPVWRGQVGPWRLAGLALSGAAAVWFSHPAAFVLGGVALACLSDAAACRDWRALGGRLAVVGAWGLSFGACYWFVLRHLGMNPYLLDYWAGTFLPLPPTRPGDVAWVVHHVLAFFDSPGGFAAADFGAGGLAAACFGVGCLALARGDRRLLVALVVPLLLAMLASGLKMYPFAGRLLLFAVPAMLLVVGHGAALVADRLGRSVRGAGFVVLGLLFVAPVAECYRHLTKPIHAEDAREVIAYAHARWQPGDRAYVSHGAAPAFGYYAARYPFPADAVTIGADNRGDPRRLRDELAALRGAKRVWVILAHRSPAEEAAVMAYLDGMGRREEAVRLSDATVLRYDLGGE